MTPEGKVKAKVKKKLALPGVYSHMPVQNGMGAPSLDFVCCKKTLITPEMVGQEVGLYFAIETKAGNKQPTARQGITIAEMEAAGAKVFVINEETGTGQLEEWLKLESIKARMLS